MKISLNFMIFLGILNLSSVSMAENSYNLLKTAFQSASMPTASDFATRLMWPGICYNKSGGATATALFSVGFQDPVLGPTARMSDFLLYDGEQPEALLTLSDEQLAAEYDDKMTQEYYNSKSVKPLLATTNGSLNYKYSWVEGDGTLNGGDSTVIELRETGSANTHAIIAKYLETSFFGSKYTYFNYFCSFRYRAQ